VSRSPARAPRVATTPEERPAREASFVAEAAAYGLEWRCEACVHVHPSSRSCSLGYRAELLEDPAPTPFTAEGGWRFCKYFELN